MVLKRTTFGFQRSYKEGSGFKYQNTLFVLKLSKALLHTQTEVLLHKLRMVCIHLKRGYKKKSSCLMKELETNLGVICQMNIFLKPYLILIAKGRRVQGTNRVAPSAVIVVQTIFKNKDPC